MSRPSSLTMWTSTDDCFCQEQVRQSLSPNWSYAQTSTSSALIASTSGSWSAGALAKQDLLHRVAAQAQSERLERDHFLGRDVAQVHVRPELLHEPGLVRLRRRLEDEVFDCDVVDDLVDQTGAHLTRRAIDAGRPTLAPLGDHLPRAGLELFLDPLHPEV